MTEFYEERLSRKPKNLAELPVVKPVSFKEVLSMFRVNPYMPEEKIMIVDTRLSQKHLEALAFMVGK